MKEHKQTASVKRRTLIVLLIVLSFSQIVIAQNGLGTYTINFIETPKEKDVWSGYEGDLSSVVSLDNGISKVYATRQAKIEWESVKCSSTDSIEKENNELEQKENYITSVFDTANHQDFYIGHKYFEADSCFSINATSIK